MHYETPPTESKVSGIVIQTEEHSENLAYAGYGDSALLDGFLVVEAISSGTNPFCKSRGAWVTYVVWKTTDVKLTFQLQEQASVTCLCEGDVLHKVEVVEDTFQGITGIWLAIHFNRPSEGDMIHAIGLVLYHAV